MPTALPRDHTNDITDAVRDTVTLRQSNDYNPRSRVARSQTAVPPPPPNSNSKPSPRRSHSQDSANVPEKPRSSGKSRGKKGSQHADVIDRLDFTGVGPMFHHDGPFDACAPSRNKHPSKAPMYAWTSRPSDPPTQSYGDSAYPSAEAYKVFSNNYADPPKKKVDAIAEAWGIHEPEPFEEFFAGGGSTRPEGDTPASSIHNGRDSHQSHSTQRSSNRNRTKDGRDAREVYKEHLEDSQQAPRRGGRRPLVPPPQPIFVPGTDAVEPGTGSPPAGSPGFPKRSKSLMQRIRKMRDAPNIPVGVQDYDNVPPSPTSPTENSYPTRPTHRTQNSFLGRFGGATPRAPPAAEKPEPFILIEAQNKDLPAPPAGQSTELGYFDAAQQGASAGSPGLGRKQSLMKKVGRVVRGK
ncbi:hypothetical protein BDQ17DRAFT_1535828 [Cyathus striatus]|nr:hypothetical protein BDQ17DRAFT_1535828 [Cyathus striatus]